MFKVIGNTKDSFAISILWGLDVVAYLPQKIYRIDTSKGWNVMQHFLSHSKYHTDLIIAKESNLKNKVHTVKTHYAVSVSSTESLKVFSIN